MSDMTTAQLIQYYQSLLILQYSSLPNAQGTVAAIVGTLIQNQIVNQVEEGFDVTDAIGAQLNILGTYRGVYRNAYGAVPGAFWSLPSVNDTLPGGFLGWVSVSDADADNPPDRWLQINDSLSVAYALTDSQMRRLIELKALLDAWDGSLGMLDSILFSVFGVYVNVVDGNNMTMIYQHQAIDPDPDQLFGYAVLENVLPHPAGVLMMVQVI